MNLMTLKHCLEEDAILLLYEVVKFGGGGCHIPAVLALVRATVSNHMGKKYMTAKLQLATRKFCMPIKTGIFCFNRNGARTGSGETQISTTTNATMKTAARTRGTITDGDLHCDRYQKVGKLT